MRPGTRASIIALPLMRMAVALRSAYCTASFGVWKFDEAARNGGGGEDDAGHHQVDHNG